MDACRSGYHGVLTSPVNRDGVGSVLIDERVRDFAMRMAFVRRMACGLRFARKKWLKERFRLPLKVQF